MTSSEFSIKFHEWLFRDNQLGLLPGYGYNDGGCYTLAFAISLWAGEQVKIVSARRDTPARKEQIEHLVCKVNNLDLYLDADGFHTRDSLITEKMAEIELCHNCYIYPVLDSEVIKQNQIELLVEEGIVLATRIEKQFGSFTSLFNSIDFQA